MWKEITCKEFDSILKSYYDYSHALQSIDRSELCDFVELEYVDSENNSILRKTEQENYDECEHYPSTVRYYKKEQL